MPQTTFSIHMDENLKKQFDSLCSDFGMNVTTAFTIFAKTVVREREIPFRITAEPKDLTEDWTKEYWDEIRIKLDESERQFDNNEFTDAFESLEQTRLKYGL